jgi:hypothetical protein
MLIRGCFMLGRIFDFIFAHVLFNGVLYFSLKNLFCGNFFLINSRIEPIDEYIGETKQNLFAFSQHRVRCTRQTQGTGGKQEKRREREEGENTSSAIQKL